MDSVPTAVEPEPHWIVRLTRTPLLGKLLVMDLTLNLFAFLLLQFIPPELQDEVTLVSLCAVLVLNIALVWWALKPLQMLEQTTRLVTLGDYDARTRMPRMADRNLVRIGSTLDALLDRVVADRDRLRTLTAQVVESADQERAWIARELHDGTAQSLAALDMLLSATADESDLDKARERLASMRVIVREALEEVRALCHDVHPRVLDDLGLQAALVSLVRRAQERTEAELVCTTSGLDTLGHEVSSVSYRIVQEAVHNALKHGEPTAIRVQVDRRGDHVEVQVVDDGRGFDLETTANGLGLFVMDERASLVDGTFSVQSRPGEGTTVRAVLPVGEPADPGGGER